MKETVRAYMAGLLDSDGHITIYKMTSKKALLQSQSKQNARYTMEIGVTNTRKELLDWLHEEWGGGVYLHTAPSWGKRPCYNWKVTATNAKRILEAVLPYLRIKQERAEIALEFQATKNPSNSRGIPPEVMEERERLFQAMYKLNHPPVVCRD